MNMRRFLTLTTALLCLLVVDFAAAHGERAQQPGLRMRTVHWVDLDIYPLDIQVGETLTVRGKFIPSRFWPEHMSSIEDTAFLNVGVPGPAFLRIDSRVNGVPMIRSTSFEVGKLYEYEMTLRARSPGRYHVHPVISVEGAGPIIGNGLWVEVGGSQAGFQAPVTTLLGDVIDLETYGLNNVLAWSALWFILGLSWFGYWLTKCPIIIPRFRRVQELGPARADEILTPNDRRAGALFFTVTLLLITGGYFWAEERWPITTPLQTGKIDVPPRELANEHIQVRVKDARYRIPGRSFRLELTVTNLGSSPVQVGEFTTATVRFLNAALIDVAPRDSHDLVARDSLRVEGGAVPPGATRTLVLYAEDALWETQRLTTLIYDPDSRFAGLLHFLDAEGQRTLVEVGGPMIPKFS